MRPRTTAIAHELVDAHAADREMDFVADFARCPDLAIIDWALRPTPLLRGQEHLRVRW